jgi:hypothetical protein
METTTARKQENMTATEITAVEIGTRVSYQDIANPLQSGPVTVITTDKWGTRYTVELEGQESKFGPEYGLAARTTTTDLRQCGWKVERPALYMPGHGESPAETAAWERIFATAATQPASTPGNNVWD